MGVRFPPVPLRRQMNEKEKDTRMQHLREYQRDRKLNYSPAPEERDRVLHLAGLKESRPKRWIQSLKEEIEKLK